MYLMRVVKTYCSVRIVPKRMISTITGKLTVTLRHRIADKKTIICYVVVEAIVSRCRSIAPSYYSCTLLFSSTPVVKDGRVPIVTPTYLCLLSFYLLFSYVIVYCIVFISAILTILFRAIKSFRNDVCIAIHSSVIKKLSE